MCTLVLAHRCLPGAPLAVAANRDEMLDRASGGPRVVDEAPRVLMPRDQVAGGTWLGLNARSLFVGITNRAGAPPDFTRRSRGLLVVDALRASDAASLHADLARLEARRYNPFHLLYADPDAAFVTWSDGVLVRQYAVGPGVHVVTERSLGGDDRGRTEKLLRLFHDEIDARPPTLDGVSALLTVHGGPGDPLSGSCVHAPEHGYGTRSGFVFIGGASPEARWFEGHPCEARQSELGPSLRELGIA